MKLPTWRSAGITGGLLALSVAASVLAPAGASASPATVITAVGAENEYASVIAQIGGRYVKVDAIMSNPNTDPHTFEASPSVAKEVSKAQLIVQNGVDPSPEDISHQDGLFKDHKVKVFVYNQQVTDSLTESFLSQAKKYGVPVVGVYETMPTPGYTYQSWMLAEVEALQKAVAPKTSTERL